MELKFISFHPIISSNQIPKFTKTLADNSIELSLNPWLPSLSCRKCKRIATASSSKNVYIHNRWNILYTYVCCWMSKCMCVRAVRSLELVCTFSQAAYFWKAAYYPSKLLILSLKNCFLFKYLNWNSEWKISEENPTAYIKGLTICPLKNI